VTARVSPAEAQRLICAALGPADLRGAYRAPPPGAGALAGHCYVASQALFFSQGGYESGWTVWRVRHEGGVHWFLKDPRGAIVDPTASQFRTPVPYERATRSAWISSRPSPGPDARTRAVLARTGLDRLDNPARSRRLPYVGQCDRLRRAGGGEEAWQEMMRDREAIEREDFLREVDLSPLLDEGETPEEWLSSMHDASFWTSTWKGRPAVFVASGGFEFIFAAGESERRDNPLCNVEQLTNRVANIGTAADRLRDSTASFRSDEGQANAVKVGKWSTEWRTALGSLRANHEVLRDYQQASATFHAVLQQYDLPAKLRKVIEEGATFYARERALAPRTPASTKEMIEDVFRYREALERAFAEGTPSGACAAEAGRFLQAGPFRLVNTGGFDVATMQIVKGLVVDAAERLHGLGLDCVLYGDVFVSNQISGKNVAAFYYAKSDEFFVRADKKILAHRDHVVHTVVHELAHRFDAKFLRDGGKAVPPELWAIYRAVEKAERECEPVPGEKFVVRGDEFVVKGWRMGVRATGLVMLQKTGEEGLRALPLGSYCSYTKRGFVSDYAREGSGGPGSAPEENFAEMVAFDAMGRLPDWQVALLEPVMSKGIAKAEGTSRVANPALSDEAIGKLARRVAKSDASYAILDEEVGGGTWTAGGCWLFAATLQDVVGRGDLFAIYEGEEGRVEHVVLRLPSGLYVDADGLSTADRLVARSIREGVKRPVLARFDLSRANDIGSCPATGRARLAKLFTTSTRRDNPLPADVEAIGRAYLEGDDVSHLPSVKAMARAQAAEVRRAFEKLRKVVHVVFTDSDPYVREPGEPESAAYRKMVADIEGENRLRIYTGGSETPLWDDRTNWMARALHDWDHYQTGRDFSLGGELATYRAAAARAEQLSPLHLSEIALQAASFHAGGGEFAKGPQKLVLPPDAIVRKVAELRHRNPVAPKGDARLAATLRMFMPPEGVAVHLVAKEEQQAERLPNPAVTQVEVTDPIAREKACRKVNQGKHWIRDDRRHAIYLRDNDTCAYCGYRDASRTGHMMSLDHLVPCEKGGTNVNENLTTCCLSCNSTKGKMTRRAFYAYLIETKKKTREFVEEIQREIRRRIARRIDRDEGKLLAERAEEYRKEHRKEARA